MEGSRREQWDLIQLKKEEEEEEASLPSAATQTDLEDMTRSEISHRENDISCFDLTHMWNQKKVEFRETES